MQRVQLQRHISLQPTKCHKCQKEYPYFMFAITKNPQNIVVCYECLRNDQILLKNLQCSYEVYNQEIFSAIPTPDTRIATECLKSLQEMKQFADKIIKQVRQNLIKVQESVQEFYISTKSICTGYINKINLLSESSFQKLLKHVNLIDQTAYISNIKTKFRISKKIAETLKLANWYQIPLISELIKKQQSQMRRLEICNVPIKCLAHVKGCVYYGTADGRIIYDNDFEIKQIKAHDSLIRSLVYDHQYTLYSGSDDFKIKAWDIHGNQPILISEFGIVPDFKSYHRDLAVFNRGKTMASTRGQFDGFKIRLWQLGSFKNIAELKGHENYIHGMVVSPSEELITVSDDKSLRVWSTRHSKCKNPASTVSKGSCNRVYFHGKKIFNVFINNSRNLLGIVDQQNRVSILEEQSLEVLQKWLIGKKIICSHARADGQYINLATNSHIYVYDWSGIAITRLTLDSSFLPIVMLEIKNKILICDGKGKALEIPLTVTDCNKK